MTKRNSLFEMIPNLTYGEFALCTNISDATSKVDDKENLIHVKKKKITLTYFTMYKHSGANSKTLCVNEWKQDTHSPRKYYHNIFHNFHLVIHGGLEVDSS